uniref:G domain-containing protein n=1 Tax=Amphimedon queenslandica TaxID=400682 RepID=A0A1X7UEL6_AMPQE
MNVTKFGNVKISHPIDSYVNILLLGNPGAGKSTLGHVINDTVTGSIALGSFRNVRGVVPCTAGIIPYKLQHRTHGNIILHDFAGHSEYYSSHSAVIENLLQGSGGVFLIVVNILEREAAKQLHQWLTVVRNEAQKALNDCHIIVIVSHVDEISNPVERRRKEEIQEIIVRERYDSVFLDCRKLGGSGVNSFFKKLSSACDSIRSTSGRNLSLYCHMMYGLLEERKENILTLSDVMSAGKDNKDYFIPDKREDVLDVLHLLHSTGLISVLKSEDKVWVVVNKGILLTEVDGIIFAPETFKEHVDIASNTGIVSVSSLTRLFLKYDPDMLICFLKNMELCQEMNLSFLRMTNLHQLAVEEEEGGGRERRGERLLFFPCLLSTDRPDEMTSQVYQFGWCLQCTGTSKHHFFPPRYFHVLSLHLAYKLALPQEDDKLYRYCTFWKNGLYWFNGHGVGSLVEIVDESQCVLVMMSCEKGYSDNMVSLRRDVIGEVISIYKESCPSLEVKELVIDPKELAYPVNTPRERTVHSVKAVLSAVVEQRPFLVTIGTRHTELKEILPYESLSDIINLSLLGGRDIKEVIEITEEFNTPLTTVKLGTCML